MVLKGLFQSKYSQLIRFSTVNAFISLDVGWAEGSSISRYIYSACYRKERWATK